MKALVLTFAVAFFAVTAGGARAYHNFWANCNYATAQPNYSLTRDGAQTYSYTAAYEGYQWGGGCWNNNDVDDASGGQAEAPLPPRSRVGGVRRGRSRPRRAPSGAWRDLDGGCGEAGRRPRRNAPRVPRSRPTRVEAR